MPDCNVNSTSNVEEPNHTGKLQAFDLVNDGSGPMLRDESPKVAAEERLPIIDGLGNPSVPSWRMIPKRKAKFSASSDALASEETTIGQYAFREEFLASIGNPTEMVLMDVFGDSMSPDICNGDTVLVDVSQREIMVGRIYAVGMGDDVVIKEIHCSPGKLLLISKNPVYGTHEVGLESIGDTIRIAGRVLWWCRSAR